MSGDSYLYGYNEGRGWGYRNSPFDEPRTESEKYDYERGKEYGEYRKRISDELDREMYGDDI